MCFPILFFLFCIFSNSVSAVPIICSNGQTVEAPETSQKLSANLALFWGNSLDPESETGTDYGFISRKLPCWNAAATNVEADDPADPAGQNIQREFGSDVSERHPFEVDVNMDEGVFDQLYQGDIVLSKEQSDLIDSVVLPSDHFGRKVLPETVGDISLRWDLPIQYSFDSSLSSETISKIEEGISFWENNTCLWFIKSFSPLARSKDAIVFFKGAGCFSSVGKVGGLQGISIGERCDTLGTITHEIGHALGFWHEHTRTDRDDFVDVDEDNVLVWVLRNYRKTLNAHMDAYGASYDYGSVMHYPATIGATFDLTRPIMIAKDEDYQLTMGHRLQPSFIDVLQMNKAYQCLDKCAKARTKCRNGGYPDPKQRCIACVCPDGFGGRLCSKPETGGLGHQSLGAGEEWSTLNFEYQLRRGDSSDGRSYWHITAPRDTVIELELTVEQGICMEGCNKGFVEIKLMRQDKGTPFQTTGYRYCCPQTDSSVKLVSEDKLAIIAYFPKYLTFAIRYRYTTLEDPPKPAASI